MLPRPSRALLIAGFASVYLFWGGTFLAIRFAIETMPPFVMAGTRHFIAGVILYFWSRMKGAPRPNVTHWKSAIIVGGLLLFFGNGGVVWSEQRIPSGLAALMVATIPLWMVLMDWLRHAGNRPNWALAFGLVLGFLGNAVLVVPFGKVGGSHVDPLSALVLMGASISWAAGSLYSRRAALPHSPLLGTAMQMIAGGSVLLIVGGIAGEWSAWHLGALSLRSVLSLAYLIFFGSLIGFTAYLWLLRVSTPAHVSTYAYVNPVVAVLVGWAFAGEPLTLRTILSTLVIVSAVILITTFRAKLAGPQSEDALLPAEECPAITEEVLTEDFKIEESHAPSTQKPRRAV